MLSSLSSLFKLIISPRFFKPLLIIGLALSIGAFGWWLKGRDCAADIAALKLDYGAKEIERTVARIKAEKAARDAERRYQSASDKASRLSSQLAQARQRAQESIDHDVDTLPDDNRVPIPADWVRVHNKAACLASGSTGTACNIDGRAGIVRDDQALRIVADNYVERCGKWRDQVLGWQQFYQDLLASQAAPSGR